MKANELMIGDWVLYNETPQQIFEISGIDDEVYLETEELVHQSEIQPIPLTPEILEKNGFIKRRWESNSYVNSESEAANICFSIGDYTNLWGGGDQDYVWVTVKYVHQFQHALRLCRIEKEIEL